ncbi:hypothetical protein DFQ27_008628, partial [Actinomortierella ambigua]
MPLKPQVFKLDCLAPMLSRTGKEKSIIALALERRDYLAASSLFEAPPVDWPIDDRDAPWAKADAILEARARAPDDEDERQAKTSATTTTNAPRTIVGTPRHKTATPTPTSKKSSKKRPLTKTKTPPRATKSLAKRSPIPTLTETVPLVTVSRLPAKPIVTASTPRLDTDTDYLPTATPSRKSDNEGPTTTHDTPTTTTELVT